MGLLAAVHDGPLAPDGGIAAEDRNRPAAEPLEAEPYFRQDPRSASHHGWDADCLRRACPDGRCYTGLVLHSVDGPLSARTLQLVAARPAVGCRPYCVERVDERRLVALRSDEEGQIPRR